MDEAILHYSLWLENVRKAAVKKYLHGCFALLACILVCDTLCVKDTWIHMVLILLHCFPCPGAQYMQPCATFAETPAR